MSVLIGDSSSYSTWAVLRTAVDNVTVGGSPANQHAHNIEFLKGFYTTEGNGFIRTNYTLPLTFGMPAFNLNSGGTFWSPNADTNFIWTDEDKAQLIGEDVTNAGTTFAITTDAFDNYPTWQVTSGVDPIYTIGKLTAF
jgi:hypothetical protein